MVCAAGLLALYPAVWIGLSDPNWAARTAFITSHLLAGASRAKVAHRAFGTLPGAVTAAILVTNLANSLDFLKGSLALRLGIGALGAAVYLLVALSADANFEMPVLALTPDKILRGLWMTQPRSALIGVGSCDRLHAACAAGELRR
jgi:hypothetical protein